RPATPERRRSLPYRPYHSHDEEQKLRKGEVHEVDVEVWPTCIVVPARYRLALTVRGKDYAYGGGPGAGLKTLGAVWSGVGPFRPDDPPDPPAPLVCGRGPPPCGPPRNAPPTPPAI